MEGILKFGENIGHIYFLFALCLIITNSIFKVIADGGFPGETRIIVGIVSLAMVLIFAALGGEIPKLTLYTFATFGAFSFFGAQIEKGYMWAYFLLYDWIVKAWTYIKSIFKK